MNKFMDYYNILGIKHDASDNDIKKAFRNLAKEWHPDTKKHSREEATKMFAEISTAYEILSDPEKRKKYDSFRNYTGVYYNFQREAGFTNHSHEGEWEDLSRWFQEIYEKHLRRGQQQVNIFLNRIRRGFIAASIGLAVGIFFRGLAIPLMVLGWFFGYYFIKNR